MAWEMHERVDLARPQGLHVWPDVLLVPGDCKAHRWCVSVYQAGVPFDLTGWAVHGYITRCRDDVLVPIDGSAEGCEASVVFDAACYAGSGELYGIMQLTRGEERVSIACGRWRLGRGPGDQLIDPEGVLPSLQELLAEISNMRTASLEATQAAANAQTAITSTRKEAQEAIAGAAAGAQAAIAKTTTDAQTALADAQMAAAQAVNGNAPPIVQAVGGSYAEARDAAQSRVFPRLSAFGRSTQSAVPTPDAPAPITSAGASGSIKVNVFGRNLFPGGAVSEVTYTDSSGVTQNRWGYAIRLPAGTYTMWVHTQEGVSGGFLYGARNSADGAYVGSSLSLVANTQRYTRVVTVDDGDVIYLYEGGGQNADYAINLFDKYHVQIVAGTVTVGGDLAVTGGSVTVSTANGLCSIPVQAGGSYTDETGQQWLADEIDLVRGVVVQRIGKVVLDGVTAGRMAASKSSNKNVNTYNVSTDDWGRAIGADVTLVLSHYPYNGTADGSSHVKMDGVMLCNVPGSMYVGHNSITTLEDYNAWLAAQHAAGTPVTVLYPLAEPVETPLTGDALAAAARLCSLYPVTTVTAEGAWVDAQYVADTKTYIDNKFAELAAQIINA